MNIISQNKVSAFVCCTFFIALLLPSNRAAGLETGLFGMEITSVTGSATAYTITTTGAQYELTQNGIEMWRRIDPATNSLRPRKVAILVFDKEIGSFTLDGWNAGEAVIWTPEALFTFNSDSVFFIESPGDFSYRHINLIVDPPYSITSKLNALNRMWTDGYGGSLHASVEGGTVPFYDDNGTDISLTSGEVAAHMVFPVRPYDFESLYGKGARPFSKFLYSYDTLSRWDDDTVMANFADEGLGIFVLFETLYTGWPKFEPVEVSPGVWFYEYSHGIDVSNFIARAHRHGFRVITYLRVPGGECWHGQDIAITLEWMRNLQAKYKLDGWYFDNADAGGFLDDYNFIRQVRLDVGDSGIIYHHDSVDVWDVWPEYSGLRAIFVDTYANYTLAGETGEIAEIDEPDDPYLRFYTCGYGLSQAIPSHKRVSSGKAAISWEELRRVMGENLHGAERADEYYESWKSHFYRSYALRKAEYLSGSLDPDIEWPPNWYKHISDVDVRVISGSSVVITWSTAEPTDSVVAYTSNEVWWPTGQPRRSGPDDTTVTDELTTSHETSLDGLDSATTYEFRIRSSNNKPGLDERIWGYVGTFSTP